MAFESANVSFGVPRASKFSGTSVPPRYGSFTPRGCPTRPPQYSASCGMSSVRHSGMRGNRDRVRPAERGVVDVGEQRRVAGFSGASASLRKHILAGEPVDVLRFRLPGRAPPLLSKVVVCDSGLGRGRSSHSGGGLAGSRLPVVEPDSFHVCGKLFVRVGRAPLGAWRGGLQISGSHVGSGEVCPIPPGRPPGSALVCFAFRGGRCLPGRMFSSPSSLVCCYGPLSFPLAS